MNGIKILGTGRYTPEKQVTNGDFSAIVDTTDEWISTRTGMKIRHFAGNGEPTWYMGTRAAKAAIEAAGIDAAEIDAVFLTTVTPSYATPSTACIVQLKVGAVNAFAMDINVACSGLSYLFDMARRYLADGDIKNILIVCAESLTQLTNYEDRSTCVLFGDGAGACVVTSSSGRFGSYIKSDANGAHLIYAKYPRADVPFLDKETELLEPFDSPVKHGIYMNGREVYKFATRVMSEAVEKACAKIGISTSELALVIPHQANARIIETAAKHLGLSDGKIYVNIQSYANTSSASIAIALDECIREGRIKRGDLVCAVGFGAGLTYGASVFEY